jgi:hypothetical protein
MVGASNSNVMKMYTGQVAGMGEMASACKILVGKHVANMARIILKLIFK